MPTITISLSILLVVLLTAFAPVPGQPSTNQLRAPVVRVFPTKDFEVTGDGSHAAWRKAPWIKLRQRPGGSHDYTTRVRLLYSKTGLYVHMDATDSKLTSTMKEDFMNLWTEDIFEVFLWTDERFPLYFEYEISPLGYELPILIPNLDDRFLGWRPWQYEGKRRTRKATTAVGGERKSLASVKGWRAEVFIPYDLLRPLTNRIPKRGTTWRANFYRVDHDGGKSTGWDWAHVGTSFHEFKRFGTMLFE